jgi:hypothetical protein
MIGLTIFYFFVQGCSGLSLMIGFDNLWAVLIWKQCEAVPLSLIGVYDLVLAVAVDVSIKKCMCIDARKEGNFKKNAMDKCYYFVPTHMKPMVLSLIESSELGGDEMQACNFLVEYANSNVKNSLNAWFDKLFQVSDAVTTCCVFLILMQADAWTLKATPLQQC